jgi:hypothetical protein
LLAASPRASALEGNTYVVWRDDAAVKATKNGVPVTPEELALLADEHADLGTVPAILRLVTARDWVLAQRVDLGRGELTVLEEAQGDEPVKARSGWMAWTVRDGDVATFDGMMKVGSTDPAVRMTSDVTSVADVEISTGRLRALHASGKMEGQVGADKPERLQGTLRAKTTWTYP